jgi:large subunit ribosomal protein L10
LTVDESTKLRVELNQANCQMQFYKNNITRRALIDAGYEKLAEKIVDRKVLAFSNDDVVAPARIIYNFAKTNKRVVLQAGIIEGKAASESDILALATLPSYETLLTQIAAGLLMPLKELAIGLNMLAEQKEQTQA